MTVISWNAGFLFIKTVKTAGTSLEVDLSRFVGDDAVVTPIKPEEAGHRPRNYLDAAGAQIFRNHMTASEIRDQIGTDRFDRLYRFCVEREPVEKTISNYRMWRYSAVHNPDGNMTLGWDDFIAQNRFPRDLQRYSEVKDGTRVLLVDHVLRYDALESQLAQVMDFVGIKGFTLKARAKSGYAAGHPKPEVTPAQRAKIYDAFAQAQELHKIDWTKPAEPLDFSAVRARREAAHTP